MAFLKAQTHNIASLSRRVVVVVTCPLFQSTQPGDELATSNFLEGEREARAVVSDKARTISSLDKVTLLLIERRRANSPF